MGGSGDGGGWLGLPSWPSPCWESLPPGRSWQNQAQGSGWGGAVKLLCLSPQLPWVCEERAGTPVVLRSHIDCGSLLGHRAVYRMCFATAAFFFLFTLLMTCVHSSRDPRAAIQNG